MRSIEFILADEAERLEPGSEQTLLKNASNEIIGLRNRLAAALRRNEKLAALEEFGVDNWEGYDEAMSQFRKQD